MYDVIITENKNGERISKLYHFTGRVTDEVAAQLQKIVKNSDFEVELLPYSNDKKKGKTEDE